MSPVLTFWVGMRGHRLLLLILAVLGVIILFFSPSCSKENQAEQIRSLIKKSAELAEKHDLSGLMKFTTEDFIAQPGKHGSREVKRILWFAFNHYGNFRIMYPEASVDLGPQALDASARVYLLIVRREQSAPRVEDLYKDPKGWIEKVGESADLYRLTLDWLKKNGDWLVKGALLQPFRGTGFGA